MNFDKYCTEGKAFLSEYASEINCNENRDRAGRIMRAILHAVRDRLTPVEASHLLSQLPIAIKGIFADQWKLAETPKKYNTMEDFFREVRANNTMADDDFADDADLRFKAECLFDLLRRKTSTGELVHVESQMPEQLKEIISVGHTV